MLVLLVSLVVLALAGENDCNITTFEQGYIYYRDSSTYLCVKEGSFAGITINMMVGDFGYYMISEIIDQWENRTGAKVNHKDSVRIGALYPAIKADVAGEAPNVYDIFSMYSNWIPEFIESGYLYDITDILNRDPADAGWLDILPKTRERTVLYDNKVTGLPVDTDCYLLYLRNDLVNQSRLQRPPRTWDELLEYVKFFHGQDLNGDGTPDYGLCWDTSVQEGWQINQIYSMLASFMQTKGLSQGFLFDTETMHPRVRNAAVKEVMRLYREFGKYSMPRHLDGLKAMYEYTTGRCAVHMYFPASQTSATFGPITGKSLVVPLPGSLLVLDDSNLEVLTPCTNTLCPHANNTDNINFAPFLGIGGISLGMNSKTSAEIVEAAFSLMAYISLNIQPWKVSTPYNPFRTSHFFIDPYLTAHWNEKDASTWLDAQKTSLNHYNAAQDIRLPIGFETEAVVVDVFSRVMYDALDVEDAVDELYNKLNALVESFPGRGSENGRAVLVNMYRRSLGLAALTVDDEPTDNKFAEWFIAVLVVSGVTLCAVIIFLAWCGTRQRRLAYRLYNTNKVAEDAAEAIASLRLEEVAYLKQIPTPNRIQTALLRIVDTLTEYRRYMPETLKAAMDDHLLRGGAALQNDSNGSVTDCLNLPPVPGTAGTGTGTPTHRYAASTSASIHSVGYTVGRSSLSSSSTSSLSTVSSSNGRKAALGFGRRLQLQTVQRDVGYMWMEICLSSSKIDLSAYSKFIDDIVSIIRNGRGVVHHFNGDVLTAHWNATSIAGAFRSLMLDVALHVSAVQLLEPTATVALQNRVSSSVGVSSGRCTVGNLGGDMMRSFTVIGEPVEAARALCKIGREGKAGGNVYCDDGIARHTLHTHKMYLVDAFQATPKSNHALVYMTLCANDDEQIEWMYHLQGVHQIPVILWNQFALCALNGDATDADERLQRLREASGSTEALLQQRLKLEGILAEYRSKSCQSYVTTAYPVVQWQPRRKRPF